jgi:isopenicillin N synthase-like dioxygenase
MNVPSTRDLVQSDPVVGTVDGGVPVIDMRELIAGASDKRRSAILSIKDACLNKGFFYLEHMFGDANSLEALLDHMRQFFALRDADPRKQAVSSLNKAGTYGWMPMFGEPAYQPGTVAHLESFDCGTDENATYKSLEGQNVWPEIVGFRESVMDFWDTTAGYGNVVLDALSEAAGFAPGFLTERCKTQSLNTLRLLHYPANDAPLTERNVGIAAHTDFECITLILQTGTGLELRDVRGRWYDAPNQEDRVVVLLGDMLERWTNGAFKATGHRVRNTRSERFSVVMFFAVDEDVLVEPMPPFVSARNPAKYPPTRQQRHIERELERAQKHRDSNA